MKELVEKAVPCGSNALEILYRLKDGHIYSDYALTLF